MWWGGAGAGVAPAADAVGAGPGVWDRAGGAGPLARLRRGARRSFGGRAQPVPGPTDVAPGLGEPGSGCAGEELRIMLGKIRGLCEQVAGGLDAEISLAESTTPMVEQSRSFR